VGATDPWVAEIADVARSLGLETFVLPVRPFDREILEAIGCVPTDLLSLDPQIPTFTGSDIDPNLAEEIYSRFVLEPFRGLIEWQVQNGLSNWINLFHPMAWVSPSVKLGVDIFVGANSSVGANAAIGSHVRINRNVSIGHDVWVGEGTEVASGAAISSGVKIGGWAFIGAGAIVLNGISIGSGATVGAGSVVTRDILPGQVVVGAPARAR